jgi:hypothetical protein
MGDNSAEQSSKKLVPTPVTLAGTVSGWLKEEQRTRKLSAIDVRDAGIVRGLLKDVHCSIKA